MVLQFWAHSLFFYHHLPKLTKAKPFWHKGPRQWRVLETMPVYKLWTRQKDSQDPCTSQLCPEKCDKNSGARKITKRVPLCARQSPPRFLTIVSLKKSGVHHPHCLPTKSVNYDSLESTRCISMAWTLCPGPLSLPNKDSAPGPAGGWWCVQQMVIYQDLW